MCSLGNYAEYVHQGMENDEGPFYISVYHQSQLETAQMPINRTMALWHIHTMECP